MKTHVRHIRSGAFTLIDIMVVVVILGVLAATIIPQFIGTTHDAKVSAAKAHIAEICGYDIEGIFIDMTFWPGVCVCHSCRSRYRAEFGEEIPTLVDWSNPQWIK